MSSQKAVAFMGNGKVELIDFEKPSCKDGEILVRVTRSALCGSDMGPDHQKFLAERSEPAIVGHESVGIVESSGDKDFPVGQRVAILVVTGCMECPACKRGRFTLCDKAGAVADTNAEYVLVPAGNLIPLPDDISYEKALLGFGCGLGVALGGVNGLSFSPGQYVAVVGVGPIGMCVIETLKQKGALPVAVDVNPNRLETAIKLGAKDTFNPAEPGFDEIRKLQDGNAIRYVIMCSANEKALITGLELLRKEGTMVLLGGPAMASVDTFRHVIATNITIRGSWHYGMEHVQEILALLRGMRNPDLVLTHVFPVHKCQEAYDLFASGNCGKVLLDWEGE